MFFSFNKSNLNPSFFTEDKTEKIVNLVYHRQRIVVITNKGRLYYSPVLWQGTTGWRSDGANLGGNLYIISEPNEILTTVNEKNNGLLITSLIASENKVNLYYINSLHPDTCYIEKRFP